MFKFEPLPVYARILQIIARSWPIRRGRTRLLQAMRFILGSKDKLYLTRLIGIDAQLALPCRDFTSTMLILFGESDDGIEAFVEKILSSEYNLGSPRTTFIDVGAHLGAVTFRAAFCNERLLVNSFEPNPELAQLLRNNSEYLGLHSRIKVFDCALSSSNGSAALMINQDNHGNACLVESTQGLQVSTLRLDSILSKEQWQNVLLMKIDVEGNEDKVLYGANELLKSWKPPLILEVNKLEIQARGSSVENFGKILRELGYSTLYAVDKVLYPPRNGTLPVCNILALSADCIGLKDFLEIDEKFVPRAERFMPIVECPL